LRDIHRKLQHEGLAIEVLDVNLRAQELLVQLLLPHLERSAKAGAGPAILGISSIEGLPACWA
jgi:NAD(P)-dependent dehydrogenase (short-subunit alcohol dehydrogenase family)